MTKHIQADNFYLLRQIVPFLKPYQKQIWVTLAFIPFIALFQGVQPFLLKQAIDRIAKSQEHQQEHQIYSGFWQNFYHSFWFLPTVLFVALLLLFVLRTVQNAIVQDIGQKFVSDIRSKLFSHLQNLSIDFFEKNQTGKLLTRLTNDIEALSETFASGLVGGANDIFSLLGISLFMLYIDWRLTLAQMLLIPILALLTRSFESSYRRANADSRVHLAQLNSIFQESLMGLPIIKIFVQENKLSKNFKQSNDAYVKANDKAIASDSMFSAVIELVGIIAIIAVILATLLFAQHMTVGKLIAFVSYAQMFYNPIRSLSEKFSTFQAGFTSMERITALLNEKPSIATLNGLFPALSRSEDSQDRVKPKLKNTNISFKSVSFKYNTEEDKKILADVSFDLPEGQSLGIVGQTGSGKSTLIKLLCRFYDPTEGAIFIDGQNIKDIDPYDLRRQVLMVPQRNFLFSGSIKDNLKLDKPEITDENLNQLSEEIGLTPILDKFPSGLNSELRERGVDLSSGQKQLISLTRAIIQEPEVLILDEATASLDSYTEGLVTNAIKKILHSGKTVIFIAHRLNLVKECNQIIVLQHGEIVEQGTHDELVEKKGYYSQLYELSEMI
ncbi:MAG: ABC transporter ATP-binding protein [Candidatus Caenarcaniphilales bacterium]|nr:ABC transporter ATP-binding protein [Candidatus Caenarcaniphilales bacterium]